MVDQIVSVIAQKLKRGFGLAFVFGILMIAMGVIAIARPLFAGITINFYLGWVLVGGGIIQLVYAILTLDEGQLIGKLLKGTFYLAAGLILLINPLEGVLTLTLVVGVSVLMIGLVQIVWAFFIRSAIRLATDWGWVLATGILATVLGIWVLLDWPSDAPWLIGLLVGINLTLDGIGIATFSAAARDAFKESHSAAS